ncbi:hypothetical protein FQN52_000942 [Onygenales sp. PD_12]|nr:hypothetical protein FQN52_000942 [Onygenales sp. PD_12]
MREAEADSGGRLNHPYDASILGEFGRYLTKFVLIILLKSHITSTIVCNLTIQRLYDTTIKRPSNEPNVQTPQNEVHPSATRPLG